MLEALRKGAGTWIAKVFIGLLVLSFAVWGIADIFGGYGRRSVATVGDTEIPYEAFQSALSARIQRLGTQVGRPLTMEEARAFGLDQHVLLALINEAALENQGKVMNLGISDKAIAERIVREPSFKDATGRFSRAVFNQLLQVNGLTESAYVARQQKAYVRQQLVNTLGGTIELPRTFLGAADVYRNETRKLKYFSLTTAQIDPVGEPTAEALHKFYEGRKSNYSVPELRQVGIMAVSPQDAAKTVKVSDDDIKAYYEAQSSQFSVPETRQLRQIPFPDEAAAQAASEKLAAGSSFDEIVTEMELSEADTLLGSVTKDSLADKKIAEAGFALAMGEVSKPIKGELTTVILIADEILPAKVTSLEDARSGIRDKLATERAAEVILDLHNRVEDERAGGATLPEIAKTLNLNYVIVDGVDRAGNGADGKAIEPAIPARDKVLAEAFRSEPGLEIDPVETAERGLVWLEVIETIAQKIRPLAEVRDKAVTDWRAAEERSALGKKAQELVDQARKGQSLSELAKRLELEVKESEPVKRDSSTDALSRAAIAQAFALTKDGFGSAPSEDGKQRVVFQVDAIRPPDPLSKEAVDALMKSLEPQVAEDLLTQYITGLSAEFGVKRNQPLIDELTGVTDTSTVNRRRGSF